MGKSLNPYEVYASQLIHLGYGHPLWDPEPPKSGPVEIGDVGFVSEGRFHRLFNAVRSKDDPINQGKVPDGFVQLWLPDERRDFVTHVVNPGEPLCSDSIQKNKFGFSADVPTGTPLSAGGSYSFTSSGKRGAVAVLKDGGIQEKVIRSAAFQKYIYNHHESWHKLATDRGFDLRVEDIVLVSGWIKTSGWELATHANRDSSHEFSLSLGASGIASANANASFQSHTRVKLLKRAGPNPATSNKDQCLFLQYYKCSNKGLGATTIVNPRNLKPSHIREEVPNGCFCSPFIGLMNWVRRCFGACCGGCCGVDSDDSSERSLENPVDALLAYILEYLKESVAVTSHTELYEILRNVKWPPDVAAYLRDYRPKIIREENGEAQINPIPHEVVPSTPVIDSDSKPSHSDEETIHEKTSLASSIRSSAARTATSSDRNLPPPPAPSKAPLHTTANKGVGSIGRPADASSTSTPPSSVPVVVSPAPPVPLMTNDPEEAASPQLIPSNSKLLVSDKNNISDEPEPLTSAPTPAKPSPTPSVDPAQQPQPPPPDITFEPDDSAHRADTPVDNTSSEQRPKNHGPKLRSRGRSSYSVPVPQRSRY